MIKSRLILALVTLALAAPLAAQDETLVPDGTLESTANSCSTSNAHTTCDEGVPGGGDWCTASTCAANPTNNTVWRFTFPTPSAAPATTTNAQTFGATVRSCASGGNAPTCQLDLHCAGVLVEAGTPQTITSSTGQDITETFTFSVGSCASDGSDAEVQVLCVASGGSPSGRRTGELDAVEWRVTWAAASTRSRSHVIGD